jgi:hypothetical protein
MGLFYCLNPLCCQLYYHTQTLTPTLYQKKLVQNLSFFVVIRIGPTLVFSAKDNFEFGLYLTVRSVRQFVSCKQVISLHPVNPTIDIKSALIYVVNFIAKHHMLFEDMA